MRSVQGFVAGAALVTLLAGIGCDALKEKEEEEKTDPNAPVIPAAGPTGGGSAQDDSVKVPQVGSIAIGGFTEESGSGLINAEEKSCDTSKMGAFGLAVGAACHTAPFAAKLMLGHHTGDFDGDGDVDCADFKYANDNKESDDDGPGLLLHLMCNIVFANNDNVVSFAFEETKNSSTEAHVISFADYDGGVDAVGSWTKGNAGSYPAEIRIWSGSSVADAEPAVAMALEALDKGSLMLEKIGSDESFKVKVESSSPADASNCVTSPSKDNCYWQDIQIYLPEDVEGNKIPNGFHLRIFAEDKEDPKFIALQGRYSYSEATAENSFGSTKVSALTSIRYVDFRTVRKGSQVWGRFEFFDENDEAIKWVVLGKDLLGILGAEKGVCQNLDKDAQVSCTDIDYTDYTDLWESNDTFVRVSESPVDADWTGKPERAALCNTQSCIYF